MNEVNNNTEKYETYYVLFSKLKHAIKYDFYLEAILISYSILEDRSKSLLVHLKAFHEKKHKDLYKKMEAIKLMIDKNPIVSKYINIDLIERINNWRTNRNVLIHGLANIKYEDVSIQKVAIEGYEIVSKFSNATTSIRRKLKSFQT